MEHTENTPFEAATPQETDTSDPDLAGIASWTEAQAERARASGLVDELTPDQRLEFEARHCLRQEKS